MTWPRLSSKEVAKLGETCVSRLGVKWSAVDRAVEDTAQRAVPIKLKIVAPFQSVEA